jgi:hypothetical protein
MVYFIDCRTNYCHVFPYDSLTKAKDEAAKNEHFLSWFERCFDCCIQVLRTDGCLLHENIDILHVRIDVPRQLTEPHSPASNGKSDRMHRAILNIDRCMVLNIGLPIRFGGDAVKNAAYVLNRSPSRSNSCRKSPLELLEGKAPSLLNIVVFGSTCLIYRDTNRRTFKECATRGIILGVPKETNAISYLYTFVLICNHYNVQSDLLLRTSLEEQSLFKGSNFLSPIFYLIFVNDPLLRGIFAIRVKIDLVHTFKKFRK